MIFNPTRGGNIEKAHLDNAVGFIVFVCRMLGGFT